MITESQKLLCDREARRFGGFPIERSRPFRINIFITLAVRERAARLPANANRIRVAATDGQTVLARERTSPASGGAKQNQSLSALARMVAPTCDRHGGRAGSP